MVLPGDGKEAPTAFRILRSGVNTSEKGEFVFDEAAAERVMAAYAAKGLDKIQIDYEHQSMVAPPGGGPAHKPAAGWFKPEVRGGELWATAVAWTAAALAMVAPQMGAPEYRYFSPILFFDQDTRQVTGLKNLALTNDPALDSLTPLAAASNSAKEPPMAEKCSSCETLSAQVKDLQEKCTTLTSRLSAFEKEDPDKKAAMTSLTSVRSQLVALTGKQTEPEALGVIAGLKASHDELVAFKARVEKERTEALTVGFTAKLDGFVKAGHMTPGGEENAKNRGWWEKKAKAVGFEQAMVELTACAPLLGATAIVSPNGEAGPTQKATGVVVLTSADREVAKEMGTDVDAFAKWKAEQAEKRAREQAGA